MTAASVFCAGLIGCGGGNNAGPGAAKPVTQSTPADAAKLRSQNYVASAAPSSSPKAIVSAAGEPAEFTVTAEQLAKDYAADRDAANAKYKGKTVRVDGKVRKIGDDGAGVSVLELIGDGELYIKSGIGSDSRAALAALKEGQDASFVGRIEGIQDNMIDMIYGEIIR